jgi:hypothetical protein
VNPSPDNLPDNVKFPPWLVPMASDLMDTAEHTFEMPKGSDDVFASKRGAIKKEWVKKSLHEALSKVDIKAIPDWLEKPVKNLILDILVESLWGIRFNRRNKRLRGDAFGAERGA